MGTKTIAVLVTIAFSVIGVLGDYFLKLASAREQPLRTGWFYLGFALYASTAFGWVFVMKHLKLATISVLYSVSLMLLLTAIGVVLFQESLNYFEVAGVILGFGVAGLALLIPDYSHVRQTVSEIGEIGSPTRVPFAIMLGCVAACILVFASAVRDVSVDAHHSRLAAYVIGF